MPDYALILTETQARVLNLACELISRAGMGQIEEVANFIPMNRIGTPEWGQLRDALRDLVPLATGLDRGAYYSIASADSTARAAYDLHQVLRHRLAWDHEPAGGIFVQFDEPRQLGDEPLPVFTRAMDVAVTPEQKGDGSV